MKDLNPEQKRAVLAENGHVLVLAGAGSGKTRVLTERIAYLILEKKVSPERILAFTFTNKAAGEMRARVQKAVAGRKLPFWVGTFHATGLKILRREAKHLGFENNFAIFDEDDSISLIRDLVKKKGWKKDEYPPPVLRNRISRWKNALIPPEEALQNAKRAEEERVAEIYNRYCGELRRCNAFDFDDLITRVVELFASQPKIKERYSRQFVHVLVDEFQDTNAIQMVMIDNLSSKHGNLFVVGDDDQAIYGWRGATVENILQFDHVYKDTITVKLEENYRSTSNILEAANTLISYNEGRKGKNLWSRKGEGELIGLVYADDEVEEAKAVRENVIELIRSGYRRNEIAILYRTHAQSRALENAMRRGGLPYQIIGGVRFYERKEIKDLLGYLKLINNHRDDVSFRRIINTPRRGIGQSTLEKIEGTADGESLLSAIRRDSVLSGIPLAQRKKVEEFSRMMASFQLEASKMTAHEVLKSVIERTDYRKHINRDPVTADTRLENIEELLVETMRFVSSSETTDLATFLEEIALLSDIDTLKADEAVALMTLHNSKGLEYRAIMITGLEDGLLPHYSSFDDNEEMEEERRLFYVGITRAKEKLCIYTASNRMRFGSWTGNEPSRFIKEIPEGFFECRRDGGEVPGCDDIFETVGSCSMTDPGGGYASADSRFREGVFVIHPTYGEGTIKKVEGTGNDMKVTVYFLGKGSKKFLANYAPFKFR